MFTLSWDKSLELGIPLIDAQHKELLQAANQFFIKCKCNQDRSATMEALRYLEMYVLHHFQIEESYQIQTDYPMFRSHQSTHKEIAFQLKVHTLNLQGSDFSLSDMNAFSSFLDWWIRDHLLGEDLAFCIFYKSLGIPLP